jgi:hypothetical protein
MCAHGSFERAVWGAVRLAAPARGLSTRTVPLSRLTGGKRKTSPLVQEATMPKHTPDTFAPEPIQESCDLGSVITTLFDIARHHMSREELAWLADVGEYADIALQNLATVAEIFGRYISESNQYALPDKRLLYGAFFSLSESMKGICALMNVGTAMKETEESGMQSV